MRLAKPRKEANFVILGAAAGYSANIPIIEARKENVILAHSFFGRKLPKEHGAPIRALVPDRYFYKSAKWLEVIKFTAKDEPGYWERNGYSNSADPGRKSVISNDDGAIGCGSGSTGYTYVPFLVRHHPFPG